jgi:hypothetical protein
MIIITQEMKEKEPSETAGLSKNGARAFSDRLEPLRDPIGQKKCSYRIVLEQIVRPGVNTPDLTLLWSIKC